MKSYSFKLETVLSLRESIEKVWEAKLGKANQECQEHINNINKYKNCIKESKDTSVEITQFQVKCLYEDRLNYQIKLEMEELHKKEIERDKIKEVYLKKSIERKVIDKLKDKSKKRYHKESLKEETLIIDEINSSSLIRNRMLGGVN